MISTVSASSRATEQLQTVCSDVDEINSFCRVVSGRGEEAIQSVLNIKKFLNIEDRVSFERVTGGAANTPIIVFKHVDGLKIPFVVLKRESELMPEGKHIKIQAMDELKESGCHILPRIFKDTDNNYLITVGNDSYSCMEYLESSSKQTYYPLDQKLKLAQILHSYSINSRWRQELLVTSLETFSNENSANLTEELLRWKPSAFETDAWKNCVKCSQYFASSPSFRDVYNQLPTQVIHGDIHSQNIVFSQGIQYLIDFDNVRTDVRLLEFSTFIGWIDVDPRLKSLGEDELIPYVESHYGKLEESEKQYFYLFLLFGRCCVLEWVLGELKQALCANDLEKAEKLANIFDDTMNFIHQVCTRIPMNFLDHS